jgi:hypothetical protein
MTHGARLKIPLIDLLLNNPLQQAGIPPGLTSREMREQLELLQLQASLGGDASQLSYMSQVLNEPASLMECELFTPWHGHGVDAQVVKTHDSAVTQLRYFMGRQFHPDPGVTARIIGMWIALGGDASFLTHLQNRTSALNLPTDGNTWFIQILSNDVLPAIVRKALDSDIGSVDEAASALVKTGAHDSRPAMDELCKRIEPAMARDRLEQLPDRYFARFVPKIGSIGSLVTASTPDQWRNTVSELASSLVHIASDRYNSGNTQGAEQIFHQLLSIDLPEADAIVAQRRIKELRYDAAWKAAHEVLERRQRHLIIPALERVLALAPDEQEAAKVQDLIWQIRNRR